MIARTNLGMLTVTSILAAAGSAEAQNINAPLQGVYDLNCESITVDAAVQGVDCTGEAASTAICVLDLQSHPFHHVHEECGRGDLTERADRALEACLEHVERYFTDADGDVVDVGEQLCELVHSGLTAGATGFEESMNGTFEIDVANGNWISAMSGHFVSDNELIDIDLPYATANFPWSRELSFGYASALPFPIDLPLACEGGNGLASAASGGTVRKANKAHMLWYNGNLTANCPQPTGDTLKLTFNVHARGRGAK